MLVHNSELYTPNPRTINTVTPTGTTTTESSETLIQLVKRYNKENGTNHSVADIRALNGIPVTTGSSTPLPLGNVIQFHDRTTWERFKDRMTVVADGIRNGASTVFNNPVLDFHQWVKDQYNASTGITAFGY